MIKPGTLCVIIHTIPPLSGYIGRFCTVISRIPTDEVGHDNMVDIGGFVTRGADKCLMPVDDGQHKTHTANRKNVTA